MSRFLEQAISWPMEKLERAAAYGKLVRGIRFACLCFGLGWAVGLSACLLPAPIEESDPLANQSPRIDKNNMTPDPTEGPKIMTTKCNSYLFFAQVFDPDPQDTLYWRVFLDYYRQQPGTKLATEIRSTKSGTVISFNVDPSDPAFFTTGTFSEVHVVELFISDRPFDDLPRAPYGRNVEEGGLTDSFVWAIDLSNTADCVSGQGGA